MPQKVEPRLPQGTIVGTMPCVGCQAVGENTSLSMTIGEKGKVFVYCKQERKRGRPSGNKCGWRAYWGRETSDALIDNYLAGKAANDDYQSANDNEETEDGGNFEIRDGDQLRDGEAGDRADDDAGADDASERRSGGFRNWFDD